MRGPGPSGIGASRIWRLNRRWRGPAQVLPRRRPDADLAPQVCAVVDGVGRVVVGEAEVLLRPRVEGALPPDARDLPDLPLDLPDDVVQRDDAVLVRRRRRQELEEVVAALRRDLRRGPGRKLREVDVVDVHLGVVRLAPAFAVDVVEPPVVGGYEVAPLDDAERACQLLVPELRDASDRRLRPGRSVDEHDSPQRRPPDELASRELVVDRGHVDALPPVLQLRSPSFAILSETTFGAVLAIFLLSRAQRKAPPVKPAMKRFRKTL